MVKKMFKEFCVFSDNVKRAIAEKKPVVALESSVITQGMPFPQNLDTALELLKIVKENGVEPAVIGIIKGKIVIGLSESEIEFLAKGEKLVKVSKQNLGWTVANKLSGGTTVSASIFIARQVGIDVFVTGGIGGVHKDFSETFDISQDLDELSKTDIIVVSSGAKSIVDLRKTVEYLETKDVLILGYCTDQFPAFYSRESGIDIFNRVETPKEIAQIFNHQKLLGIKSAILVANPIPEEFDIPYSQIEVVIEKAISEAKIRRIKGKELTPFLLNKIAEKTKGKSLISNIELLKNNARLGALIAKEVAMVEK